MTPGRARRCAVLGSPIDHSLSPVLHRAAYAELGLDWTYAAQEMTEEGLAEYLDGLDASWRGLSLTMPLKRAVVPLLDELAGRAVEARAANTVLLADGRRVGHNTDVPGIVAAVRERTDRDLRSAVVLGGGATAASAVLGLADLGCSSMRLVVREAGRVTETLAVAGRHPARPSVDVLTLGEAAGAVAATSPDIVVSTVPASAQGEALLRVAARAPVVFDVGYDPWPTPLARMALERGTVLVSGLDLLVHQAVLQVQLMTGARVVPLAAMRVAGEAALAARVPGDGHR
jgi:shikimate dehydrogenase